MGRKKKFEDVVSIRLPTTILAGIDEIAKEENKSRSDIVREIVTTIIITKDPTVEKLFENELGPLFENLIRNMLKDSTKEKMDKISKEINKVFEEKIIKSPEMKEIIKKYYPESTSKKKTKQ